MMLSELIVDKTTITRKKRYFTENIILWKASVSHALTNDELQTVDAFFSKVEFKRVVSSDVHTAVSYYKWIVKPIRGRVT